MLLCLKAENRMRFRSRPQIIILALRGREGRGDEGGGVGGGGGEGASGRGHWLEQRCPISTDGVGVWVIMSAPGAKLLTLVAATVVNTFL